VSKFTEEEIKLLYSRFQTLDRTKNGYISTEEFLLIPELSMNPLSERVVPLFVDELGRCNFENFVSFLWLFNRNCDVKKKREIAFRMYDCDKDGRISIEDLEKILKIMVGNFVSPVKLNSISKNTIEKYGGKDCDFLTLTDFEKVISDEELMKWMTIHFD
ncbi:Calcineurin subunit B type 1, partial [Bonamia ostreae]